MIGMFEILYGNHDYVTLDVFCHIKIMLFMKWTCYVLVLSVNKARCGVPEGYLFLLLVMVTLCSVL